MGSGARAEKEKAINTNIREETLIDTYIARQEKEGSQCDGDSADSLDVVLLAGYCDEHVHWRKGPTLIMKAHRQPARPSAPWRVVASAPWVAPESMAPAGWAML